jgi:hypothetical protein
MTWGRRQIIAHPSAPLTCGSNLSGLAPKSKVHVRGLPTQRSPMELVTNKGATKRVKTTRSLTVEEFQRLLDQLAEPFRAMALVRREALSGETMGVFSADST